MCACCMRAYECADPCTHVCNVQMNMFECMCAYACTVCIRMDASCIIKCMHVSPAEIPDDPMHGSPQTRLRHEIRKQPEM